MSQKTSEIPLKERQKLAKKKYRETNKDKLKSDWRKYYDLNKDRLKQKRKLYYLSNLEAEKEKSKKYRLVNSGKIKESYSKWAKTNREKLNASYNERINSDTWFKIRVRLSNKLSKCLRGIYKNKTTLDLLGCTIEEFKEHLESQFKTGMSWDNYGKNGWHIDHIKPCALFDFTKIEDQKLCFHYTNMQPMWSTDNFKKGKKYND